MAYHSYAAQKRGQSVQRASWQVEMDTETEKTDACGVYSASASGGRCPIRYVRMDYATDMHALRAFLHTEWQMEPLHFLVTLIGSTSPVYLRKKMRSAVQRALVRLVETCDQLGGWLLASGAGVTQQMSAALNEQMHFEREVLHLIAVQPWGTLRYNVRSSLVSNSDYKDVEGSVADDGGNQGELAESTDGGTSAF